MSKTTSRKNRPWVRHLIDVAVIVVSILLAFSIDAWWGDRQNRKEEGSLLAALLQESRNNMERLDHLTSYHHAMLDAIAALLSATATVVPDLDADSLDHLLVSVSGWLQPGFELGTLEAVILGGKLTLIEDEHLRSRLASLRRDLETAREMESYAGRFAEESWIPFLRQNAYLPQIINAQPDTIVGTGKPRYSTSTPVHGVVDHRSLLRDRVFANLLQEMKWTHEDALNYYSDFGHELGVLIEMLEEEVGVGPGGS